MTTDSSQLETLPETRSSTVIAIGPWNRGECAVVRGQIADSDWWSLVPDCETASELLARNELMPEVILLAEPLPATYSQVEIETLRQEAPLAQIVVVAGTWCEGELRTGKPQQGVLRVYWHEFAPWWQARINEASLWSPYLDGPLNPRDSAAELTLEASIAVYTPTFASYETLAAALGRYGAKCQWIRDFIPVESAAIGVWDGAQLDPEEWQRLKNFATKLRQKGGSLVVLLDFPRQEHISRLKALGCGTVIGKPYIVGELVAAIGRLLGPRECNPWA